MSIDRPPFRIERKDGHSAIRIMLTKPLYKYYGVISNSTKIAGAPEAIIEIREYVNALIGELHVAGWTITFCIAGLLTYLVERAVSIDAFEYVRKSTGYGEDYGNNYGGGEYYDVVVVEQT